MTAFSVSEKPAFASRTLDPDNDALLGLDVSDTTEAASGSVRLATARQVRDAIVPTIAALSTGDAVNTYIAANNLASASRFGPIYLPQGIIQQANPLSLDAKMGTTVQGAGPHINRLAQDATNAWDTASVNRATRFEFTGDVGTPAAHMLGCSTCCYKDLTIEHRNNGECLRVGRSGGFYSSFNRCERLWMVSGSIGCRFMADGDGFLNADHCFDNCIFQDCTVGVQTDGGQQVAYSFNGMCYWTRCDIAIHCVGGGCTYTQGCACNGVGTFLKVDAGGANTGPHVINGLRLDRTGESQLPVVVDFSSDNAGGSRHASVNGLQVTTGAEIGDHFFFRVHEDYAAEQTEIVIGQTNLRSFGPLNRVHAIGVYNDSGTRVGHIYDGVYTALADESF